MYRQLCRPSSALGGKCESTGDTTSSAGKSFDRKSLYRQTNRLPLPSIHVDLLPGKPYCMLWRDDQQQIQRQQYKSSHLTMGPAFLILSPPT